MSIAGAGMSGMQGMAPMLAKQQMDATVAQVQMKEGTFGLVGLASKVAAEAQMMVGGGMPGAAGLGAAAPGIAGLGGASGATAGVNLGAQGAAGMNPAALLQALTALLQQQGGAAPSAIPGVAPGQLNLQA